MPLIHEMNAIQALGPGKFNRASARPHFAAQIISCPDRGRSTHVPFLPAGAAVRPSDHLDR